MTDHDYEMVDNAIQAHMLAMNYLTLGRWRLFEICTYVAAHWIGQFDKVEHTQIFFCAQEQLGRSPLFTVSPGMFADIPIEQESEE